jgi:hypothetical protein
MFRLENSSAQSAKFRRNRGLHLRIVFRKGSAQTQPILPQRSAGKVLPLPGLIDYTTWQKATDVREDGDPIYPARWLAWTIFAEIWLVIVTVLLLVMIAVYRLFSVIFN